MVPNMPGTTFPCHAIIGILIDGTKISNSDWLFGHLLELVEGAAACGNHKWEFCECTDVLGWDVGSEVSRVPF